jgi:hypothetical protein
MPRVGFEVITPDYEPAKIVHASEGVAAVIDWDGTIAGRKLNNEELYNLYSSPNMTTMIE